MDDPACFVDVVMDKERAAASLYRSLAARKENTAIKEVLDYLAREEEDHAQKLAGMGMDRECSEEFARAFEELAPLLDYINEEDPSLDSLLAALDDREKVLKLALLTEKNSVLLYSQLADRLAGTPLEAQLRRVAEQELEHFNTFFKVLKILQRADKGPWRGVDEIDRLLREAVATDHRVASGGPGGQ